MTGKRMGLRWPRATAGLLVLAAMTGCARFAPEVLPPLDEPIETVVVPEPAEPAPLRPESPARPLERVPLPSVAIVVAGSEPAYTDVAMALGAELPDYELYDLSDSSRPPVSVLRSINDSTVRAVVAIGLRAAQSSVAMAGVPVIFSQVFNYQEHQLISPSSRGVAALPPPRAQLAAWRSYDPAVVRIGTIVGEGHDDLLAEAEVAARELGLELVVRTATSDQETLYLFRRMVRDIDGFWLLPDNRILSRRALEAMLAEAGRLNVPVAVPNEAMLEVGGSISMAAVPTDVAATILQVLRQIEAGRLDDIPAVTPLSEIRVKAREKAPVAGQ